MLSIAPPQQKGHIKYLPTIAEQVYCYEMGIYGEKKARYTENEHGAFNLNVDSLDAEGYVRINKDYICSLVDILQMIKGF